MTPMRAFLYVLGLIAGGLSLAGYASFDADTWVIDIAPFNLREAALTAVQTVGNGLAFLAVWRKWGVR